MRPISERRLAANRANAKKSTGPRTPEGKARSSMNAMVHGLSARRVVLPNEDRGAFEAFARAMRKDLRPDGPVQAMLVEEVIGAAWRLRRAGEAEMRVVRHALARYAGSRRRVTPGALLADALADDPRATPYLHLEGYTQRVQRSFFSALRRLHAEQRRPTPIGGEPSARDPGEMPGFGVTSRAAGGYGSAPPPPAEAPPRQVRATNPNPPAFSGESETEPPAGTP